MKYFVMKPNKQKAHVIILEMGPHLPKFPSAEEVTKQARCLRVCPNSVPTLI